MISYDSLPDFLTASELSESKMNCMNLDEVLIVMV